MRREKCSYRTRQIICFYTILSNHSDKKKRESGKVGRFSSVFWIFWALKLRISPPTTRQSCKHLNYRWWSADDDVYLSHEDRGLIMDLLDDSALENDEFKDGLFACECVKCGKQKETLLVTREASMLSPQQLRLYREKSRLWFII